jgi:predicted DNA binding CopG/RHH family protein
MGNRKMKSFEEEDRKLVAEWEGDIAADRIVATPLSRQTRSEIGKAAALALARLESRRQGAKNSRITLRVNDGVLKNLKSMASKRGMPYQTFIGHLLTDVASHKTTA